ncbi:hypothetical protein LTR10_022457 [Elasticomyces elasticus]|uniref:Major facilitator superfamily (MFS) profile domain-containing protein n=1 Tax=Exophiala sideris TaxID=1016849 RepID=A0ABR0J2V6_9EURO|nr:hypothetical protein LTR10_022457 [Elasticomyces elasticus]KAK5024893.1 hypothetical protein LTS07_008271 [Exophiala sideris]KAK5031517.1 hypothetical protein LTR13_007845 [Exophiala sideris]KAK5054932.1 hypothetical protein LTR69_008500 [Exophiala sideris]KAK5179811.1 hypothetical protein LTR44_007627 [Eurotiomycetes sp. CCFEE 6388]
MGTVPVYSHEERAARDVQLTNLKPESPEIERIPTVEIDNYHGINLNIISGYAAVCAMAFAMMQVIIGSGLLARSMAADIGGSTKSVWVAQTVTIVNLAAGVPVSQAADYWGRKWPMLITCFVALIGSIVLSRAQTMTVALFGNFLAAVSTAGQPLFYTVASEIVPRLYRPMAQAGIGLVVAASGMTGLLAGSALTRHNPAGWRVIWYIEIGLFAFSGVILYFLYNPPPRPEQISHTHLQRVKKLDLVGIFLLVSGVTLFSIGLIWFDNPYSFKDPHVNTPFAIGLVLILCLIYHQIRVKKDGIFHHQLFNQRNVWIAAFGIGIEGAAFFGANTYFPLEVSVLFEPDSFIVGTEYCVLFFANLPATFLAGWWSTSRKDLRTPLLVGFACFIVFFATMASVDLNDKTKLWSYVVFLGFGLGCLLGSIVALAQLCAPPHLISITTGIMTSLRGIGTTILLPCTSAIFNSKIKTNLPSKIAAEVIPLGLAPQALAQFIPALANNDPKALQAVPGVTPQIIQAGVHGLKTAYLVSLRPVWLLTLALSAVAFIACIFIKDPKHDFTKHVDAPLDVSEERDERAQDKSAAA